MFKKVVSSALLADEPPLLIQPKLAVKVGLNEAILLQQVHYWLHPKVNKNIKEGRPWVHNTYDQWKKQFPFWSERTIRRTISSLENLGILESYSSLCGLRKTKYYTINYTQLSDLSAQASVSAGQSGQIHLTKTSDRSGQDGQLGVAKVAALYNHYTETTTETSSFLPSGASARLKEEKDQSIDVEKKIVQIWNETVQRNLAERPVTIIPKRLILIEKVFRPWFNADLDAWQSYCDKVASCRFLMGQNIHGFRASFEWALCPENIAKILEGAIYDRLSLAASPEEFKKLSLENLKEHLLRDVPCERWREVCFAIAQSLSPITYQAWFAEIEPLCLKTKEAQLRAPTNFIADYITEHHANTLLRALKETYPHIERISFVAKDGAPCIYQPP